MSPVFDDIVDNFDEQDPEQEESGGFERFIPDTDWQQIHEDGLYSAYARDDDFMWRWNIVRDGGIVQEGCSISLETARRSVGHVLAFYAVSEGRKTGDGHIDEEFSE
jgi:soluble methane monooxygenase-binding protein MmoD